MIEGGGWFAKLFGNRVGNQGQPSPLSLNFLGKLQDDIFDTSTAEGQFYAYIYNSVIRTVIDRRAEAFINGRWYNTIGDKESNSQHSKAFYELVNIPNGLQSSAEFKSDIFRSLDIYGVCYILKITLAGFSQPKGFIVLPNHLLTVYHDWSLYPMQISTGNNIKTITLQYNSDGSSYTRDLTPVKDSIIVIRSSNTPGQNGSKLQSLQDQINKLHVANNASNDILKHHGALGILSDDSKEAGISTPMTNADQQRIQSEYQNYGIGYGTWKLMITNKSIKYTPISLPIKDLMLNETTRDATRQICDTLGYPIDLLGFEDGAKLSSTGGKAGEAKKMLYQDMVIPQAQLISDAFSRSEFQGKETVNIDFSHVEPLQQSQVDIANKNKILADTYASMIASGIITVEEARQMAQFNEIITDGTKV